MPLPKLHLTAPEDNYSFQDGESVLRAQVGAGPSRSRLDMLGAPIMLSVTLVLDGTGYQYWRAFYRSQIAEGSLPFIMDLIIDRPELEEHEVKLIPGSSGLGARRGEAYQVPLQLEVRMPVIDADYDAELVALYAIYGDDSAQILGLLAALVNVDLAGALS
jgi:hypothetical protein